MSWRRIAVVSMMVVMMMVVVRVMTVDNVPQNLTLGRLQVHGLQVVEVILLLLRWLLMLRLRLGLLGLMGCVRMLLRLRQHPVIVGIAHKPVRHVAIGPRPLACVGWAC